MATIYTVSQLNNEIKDLLDAVPGYRGLMVQGEISNYKAHSSGHHYMTLKDENAAINAVMFRSDAMRLKFRLQNGMKVIVKARVSSFPRTGAVQLYVSEIIPDGAGALNLAFEQLKAKLQAEGLFSERYKKPIPSCPDSIALVTSPTGAAVRDMIRILGRRWPLAKVVLYPAQVQGQGAAESRAAPADGPWVCSPLLASPYDSVQGSKLFPARCRRKGTGFAPPSLLSLIPPSKGANFLLPGAGGWALSLLPTPF